MMGKPRNDWDTIRTAYVNSDKSMQVIAKEFNVAPSAVFAHAKKEDWVGLRSQYRVNKANRNAREVNRIQASMEKKFWNGVDILTDKIYKVVEASDFGKLDTNQIKDLAAVYKMLQDIRGFKNKADQREQLARIQNLERQIEEKTTPTNELVIKIDGGTGALEEYSK